MPFACCVCPVSVAQNKMCVVVILTNFSSMNTVASPAILNNWVFSLVKAHILYCLSSTSHSCQRSNNSVFDLYYPKHIRGPAFQLSKSRFAELYSEHFVSVPAPLNANELCLSTPTWGALPCCNTVSKFLDTVRIVSASSLHMIPDFLLWQPSSIIISWTSHSFQTPLHSGRKWS